jgi:hypothetical protein
MLRSMGIVLSLAVVGWIPAADVTTAFSCATDLGVGLKSRRKFCDIVISTTPKDGVMLTIPAHAGPSTLMFDLHNRYTPAAPGAPPEQMYAKQTAVVSVLDQNGAVVGRAAVSRELRTDVDLFDRIAGGIGPGGAIAVAPGRAESITLQLPEPVTAVAVVGVSLEALSVTGQGMYTTPGRPVAIGSNFRIEYTRR